MCVNKNIYSIDTTVSADLHSKGTEPQKGVWNPWSLVWHGTVRFLRSGPRLLHLSPRSLSEAQPFAVKQRVIHSSAGAKGLLCRVVAVLPMWLYCFTFIWRVLFCYETDKRFYKVHDFYNEKSPQAYPQKSWYRERSVVLTHQLPIMCCKGSIVGYTSCSYEHISSDV